MVRVLNFVCVALMGLSILALYHVSEQTRVAQHANSAGSAARSPRNRPRSACCRPNGNVSPVPRASRNWREPIWA